MAVFRVERTHDYTVMSNHHLRDKNLSLKAKGLLSQMLSLPEDWDYTLGGLAYINKESRDAIRSAVRELEAAGYIQRRQTVDEHGRFSSNEYVIYEHPIVSQPSLEKTTTESEHPIHAVYETNPCDSDDFVCSPSSDKPLSKNPPADKTLSGIPTQINTDIQTKDPQITDQSITDSFHSYESMRSEPILLDTYAAYRELIRENINYDVLCHQLPDDIDMINEIVELITETVSCNRSVTRVGKTDYSHDLVRSRLLKLDDEHIRFVIHCLKSNKTQIRCIRQYLLTALFNAPSTISSYYTAQVNLNFCS